MAKRLVLMTGLGAAPIGQPQVRETHPSTNPMWKPNGRQYIDSLQQDRFALQ
jgi:hypothetical protein